MTEEQKPQVKVTEFKSKLFLFPKAFLDEIDRRIHKGHKADAIRKYVAEGYKGELSIPNRKVFARYIKWRREHVMVRQDLAVKIRKELEPTEQEIRALMERLNVAGMDISDRKIVLERLVVFLMARTQMISQVQDSVMDPRFEQNIIGQVAEIHAMLQTLLKLEGQLGVHEAVARLIVEKFLFELAPIVRKAAEDTYGQAKTKEFLDRLQKAYKAIDFNRIRNEAVIEVSALGKETSNGKEARANAA